IVAAQTSTVYYDNGSVLAQYHGTEDRIIVPLDQISPNLQQAVVAAEDRTFFTDPGVSLRGTLRALWVDLTGKSIQQGGSTITQEYVRNVFTEVGNQRTIIRKLKEATLAIKFARKYSKNEILADYLNVVYFGRGAYGAQAAAQAYFGVSAADLTVGEAAYLAGILRGPEYYQPETNPGAANNIRNVVLSDMEQVHDISSGQQRQAEAAALPFVSATGASSATGAYFVEYVRRLLESQYSLSDQQVETGGLKIYTTLDPTDQVAAEQAVANTLTASDDPQAALVSMSTNGEIRAMVGGRDVTSISAAQGFNFAYQEAPGGGRQAGSAFKPFTLAQFLSAGYSINSIYQAPASIQVTSRQCQNLDGSPWSVSNFMNEAYSNLNITQATANSVNTVYAQMVDMLGPHSVATMADTIGGWTNLPAVCSITLGTPGVTPLEMARAYATFATQGQRPVPLAVLKVVTPSGQVLINNQPQTQQVLDPNIANTVNQVLQNVLTNGTAAGKGIGRPAAGKTGTTDNLQDAWFVGYTPSLSTAVWMGYTTNPTTGTTAQMTDVHGIQVTGGTLPATIWQRYMKAAVAGTPVQKFVAPTITGKVIGPSGAPCPGNQLPTPTFACVPPGSPCPSASPTSTVTSEPGATTTATAGAPVVPCPSPSEVLPPDIIIPSPTPSPGSSPGAKGKPSPKALGPPENPRTQIGAGALG
ncbi:MAG: transglycosylase domain-containing protein, partial [Actinomycetota bacterium]